MMKILILNWRDIKNTAGGGAELLTHEMAKRWARWGHEVTQISAGFPGSKKEERVDGVKIIRLGTWWTVHFLAIFYYLKNLRNQIDVIVDEVHWFPFFAVLYARRKTVLLACEVAKKNFFVYFSYPVAFLWRQLEKIYFFLYRNIPALTISPSTKRDLINEGLKEDKIAVLPMGLTVPAGIEIYPKEKDPSIIYLGRINKLKGAEDAVEAFKIVKKEIPEAKLWFVGSGLPSYERRVKQKVVDYNFTSSVNFLGFVSEKKKFELLSKAHVLIVPSIHEGWGLVVSEAGFVETPAVVYNVPGLRDVVENGVNGLICESNTSVCLAKNVIRLLQNEELCKKLSENARGESKKMNWRNTAKVALKVLQNIWKGH